MTAVDEEREWGVMAAEGDGLLQPVPGSADEVMVQPVAPGAFTGVMAAYREGWALAEQFRAMVGRLGVGVRRC